MIMNKTGRTGQRARRLIILASLILCLGLSATQALAVTTTNNNFTMIDPGGGLTGGTNNVTFTWDGTMKTSVAVSSQVSNATLSSPCPFSGVTWNAHDVAIYGPAPIQSTQAVRREARAAEQVWITFTVGARTAFIALNWLASFNIDVVDVWTPSAVFAPSPM
jgi:hypothetical protein